MINRFLSDMKAMSPDEKSPIVKFLSGIFFFILGRIYLFLFPNNIDIINYINEFSFNKDERHREIQYIRVNNIISSYWRNLSIVVGTFVTVLGVVLTYIIFAVNEVKLIKEVDQGIVAKLMNWLTIHPLILLTTSIFASALFLLIILPYFLRRALYQLTPTQFAELSFLNLNQSQILTFTAMNMYGLCFDFKQSLKLPKSILNIAKQLNENSFSRPKVEVMAAYSKELSDYQSVVEKFYATQYKRINNCVELMKLSSRKLNIKEREYCNHILKFSPYIFHQRLIDLKTALDTLCYITSEDKHVGQHLQLLEDNVIKVLRIHRDISIDSSYSLLQIICFKDTHDSLISMASIVSTSRSLQFFLRGLCDSIVAGDTKSKKLVSERKMFEHFRTILHRSKAHYGLDLLILLENFYLTRKNSDLAIEKIPSALHFLKFGKLHSKSLLTENYLISDDPSTGNLYTNILELNRRDKKPLLSKDNIVSHRMRLFTDYKDHLKDMRLHLVKDRNVAMKEIHGKFTFKIQSISRYKAKNPGIRIYFVLFGYSKIVRDVLRHNAESINKSGVKIFVVKSEDEEMLDTQVYRFELNNNRPDSQLRHTFTASDDFFKDILTKNDKVIFIGGAEIYDITNQKLFHTNNYHERVIGILDYLASNGFCKPRVWIVAGRYKIFQNFADHSTIFGDEFYADHYDEIDMYDFKSRPYSISTISNDGKNYTPNTAATSTG